MRVNLLVAVFVLLGLSTACEEMAKVLPKEENKEETTPPESSPPEKPVINADAEKQPETEIRKYVISQGEQHATLSFQEVSLDTLKFRALFDSSAIYQTVIPENQGDINKLYGFSDCESYHHTNSARFGWRWYKNQLEIWAYTYLNGERKSAFLDTVALDKFYDYEIRFFEDNYLFILNDKKVSLPRACRGTAKGYRLFPYFGGDETAPHEIRIWIEEIKK